MCAMEQIVFMLQEQLGATNVLQLCTGIQQKKKTGMFVLTSPKNALGILCLVCVSLHTERWQLASGVARVPESTATGLFVCILETCWDKLRIHWRLFTTEMLVAYGRNVWKQFFLFIYEWCDFFVVVTLNTWLILDKKTLQ